MIHHSACSFRVLTIENKFQSTIASVSYRMGYTSLERYRIGRFLTDEEASAILSGAEIYNSILLHQRGASSK